MTCSKVKVADKGDMLSNNVNEQTRKGKQGEEKRKEKRRSNCE